MLPFVILPATGAPEMSFPNCRRAFASTESAANSGAIARYRAVIVVGVSHAHLQEHIPLALLTLTFLTMRHAEPFC